MRIELENIIIEIKQYKVHLRQQVLNFYFFNYIFDRQVYVIYSYMISLILGDNRLRSFSNDFLEFSSKFTVLFRPPVGKQCLLCRYCESL